MRGYAVTHPAGTVRLPQSDRWDQLVYASTGLVRVTTDGGAWVLPPQRAAWIPGGVQRTTRIVRRASMRTLYFPVHLRMRAPTCQIFEVTPLVRELILHACRRAPLALDDGANARLIGVFGDQLATLPVAPLELPNPPDGPAGVVASTLIDDPGTTRTTAQLASAAGASRRTVERAFVAATAMTVGQWRQRLRLLVALERLAAGEPVGRVATRVGYATQSAFGAMFKAQLGASPAAYVSARGADRTLPLST